MSITPEQLREKFEAWARPDSVQSVRTDCGISYRDSGMSAGWSAWQSAFAEFQKLQESRIDELLAALSFVLRGMDGGHIKCAPYIDFDPDATELKLQHPADMIRAILAAQKGGES